MRKFFYLFVLIVALITSCSSKFESEVYVRDLMDLNDGDLLTDVIFYLPLPSEDDCAEYRARYDKVFAKSKDFKSMEYVKCSEIDYGDYAEYKLKTPLRLGNPSNLAMESAVDLILHDRENSDGLGYILIRVNPPSLHDLDILLKDEFYRGLDFSETSPLIRISNDSRVDHSFIFVHVFVNDISVLHPTDFLLEPRDDLDIYLSNVASAYLFYVDSASAPRVAIVGIWHLEYN